MKKFIIVKDALKKIKRFNYTGRTLEFKIKPIPPGEEPVKWLRDAINQIIEKGTEGLRTGDQVGFNFCSKDFQRGDGWLRFRPVEEIKYDDLWDMISGVYQSNSCGLNTATFCLNVTSIRMPLGKGRARKYNNYHEECLKRGGIITINNRNNLCLPLALITAISYVNKDPSWIKVRRNAGGLQTQRALNLLEEAGVTIPEDGCGMDELEQFQRELHGYKIVVYIYGNKGRDVMFEGPNDGKKLNLLYHKGHYNVITSLTSAFCTRFYCQECHVSYEHKNKHRCVVKCPCCFQSPVCPQAPNVVCPECKRSFRGASCCDNHWRDRSFGKGTVCEQIKFCTDCLKTVKSDRKHTCGEIFCKICYTHMPQDHLCYIQPDKGTPKTKDTLFIFYDLETRQEGVLEDGSNIHEPNLCVFKQCCDACIETNIKICNKCGVTQQVLRVNPVNNFTEYVFNQRQLFKQVVVMAHNGQAFDLQFCLNYILTKTYLKPDLITRGRGSLAATWGGCAANLVARGHALLPT
ncbi:hypothetical protein NQ317_013404 [Molorchus minor]|uniref:DNA-directed DNA polymerase n=1 Tax=Molorchus minor TaxID=1323400 RepID=A0ABQ9IUT7_9CUCU|nr:hypothetical protein NQ317_013404 [Molorchus minor]